MVNGFVWAASRPRERTRPPCWNQPMDTLIETDDAPLPGEGETRTQTRCRRKCDHCERFATVRHGLILPNARRNPSSSGYGKDDISWCSDAEAFACSDHDHASRRMEGYEWCSSMTLSPRFAHMFLHWV